MPNIIRLFSNRASLICVFAFLVFSIISTSSFAYYKTDLIAGQHYDVGDVTVWNDSTKLYVQFQTNFGWFMSTTHVHVATSLDAIPQKNGNPIPGRFAYKTDHNPPVWTYTYTIPLPSDGKLYIATHADVCGSSLDFYSGTVNLTTQFGVDVSGSTSYLIANVNGFGLNGIYNSYCLEPKKVIEPNWLYTAGIISSYDTNEIPNLDLINFIINQNYISKGYTFSDIQQAIWKIITGDFKQDDEKIGAWDPVRADKIVGDAYAYRSKYGFYVPPPCGLIALVISPVWELYIGGILIYSANDQKIIIIVPVPCGSCETAWGAGPKFSGANWAMYFTYDVEGPVNIPSNNTKKGKK